MYITVLHLIRGNGFQKHRLTLHLFKSIPTVDLNLGHCICSYVHLPNSLLIKGLVLKGSKSSMCSPVPMKIIGDLVMATLEGWGERRGQYIVFVAEDELI